MFFPFGSDKPVAIFGEPITDLVPAKFEQHHSLQVNNTFHRASDNITKILCSNFSGCGVFHSPPMQLQQEYVGTVGLFVRDWGACSVAWECRFLLGQSELVFSLEFALLWKFKFFELCNSSFNSSFLKMQNLNSPKLMGSNPNLISLNKILKKFPKINILLNCVFVQSPLLKISRQ